MRALRPLALLGLLGAAGCYRSFELGDGSDGGAVDAAACSVVRPTCLATNDDACGLPRMVDPICDPASRAWHCAATARPFVVGPTATSPCLPFHDPSMGIRLLAGSIVRVPTPDGRCLWIADSVTPTDGAEISNVAFFPDLGAPYGTCPTRADVLGGTLHDAVVLEGSGGPEYLVQITGGWLDGGETVVSYRLFHYDPMGGFGVTEDGTGLGRWDAASETIRVPGPAGLRWAPNVDLGDAVLPARGERSYTYIWGCPPPVHDLVEDCVLGRFAPGGATELFTTAGWSASSADLATTFTAGPWLSSVTADVHGFAHVYAIGFGSALEQQTATFPYGPWTDAPTIARCDLPTSDTHAYCAGPVVHEELDDPTRSDDMAITYGLGTTDMPGTRVAAHPDDYWTRLVWVRAP